MSIKTPKQPSSGTANPLTSNHDSSSAAESNAESNNNESQTSAEGKGE
jgi:hypothetical protein